MVRIAGLGCRTKQDFEPEIVRGPFKQLLNLPPLASGIALRRRVLCLEPTLNPEDPTVLNHSAVSPTGSRPLPVAVLPG